MQPYEKNDKVFNKYVKMIFSSLTARTCIYVYFNIIPGVLIFSNSTESKAPHGNRIMNYSVSELSMHFVTLHKDFLDDLYRVLCIPQNEVFCLNTKQLIAALSKIKYEEIVTFRDEELLVMHGKKDTKTCTVIGEVIDNFHIIKYMHDWYYRVEEMGTEEHKAKYAWIEKAVDVTPVFFKNLYEVPIHTTDFVKNNERIFKKDAVLHTVGFDGLTCVSLREFVKKLKEPYSLKTYMFCADDRYILKITKFDNEMVSVKTIMPNVLTIPL